MARKPAQERIRFAHGANCNTTHTVPAELTDIRLKTLMDAVYLGRYGRASTLGWLAMHGYIHLVHGSAYVTLAALPLVRAVKRAGYYYWAGAQEPNLVTDEGKCVSHSDACAFIRQLASMEPQFPPAWMDHVDTAIRAIKQDPQFAPERITGKGARV